MLNSKELEDLCKVCKQNDILFMSDEIYHGISYGAQKVILIITYSKQMYMYAIFLPSNSCNMNISILFIN